MITYNWNVVKMEAYPEKDGLTDVVFHVHWTLTGIDGAYEGNTYGSVNIALDESVTYTPYNELTQEQVIGWVKEILGEEQVASLEANVATQIQNQINPPVVTPPLPWAS
jgi:hypothetical protein